MEIRLRPNTRDGKRKLMSAASTLFANGSLQGVSVAQILELSGVKAPSLYHHFQDKEGLYVAWATQTLAELGADLKSATSVENFINILLDGARVDYLQINRDLRDLSEQANRDEIRESIQLNLIAPATALIKRINPEIADEELIEEASFLLHSAMYGHPIYSSMRKGTRINGRMATWLANKNSGGIKH